MSKYHAKRVSLDGITFDSMAERERYCQLRLLELCGSISNLEIHKSYLIFQNGKDKIRYIADFVYRDCDGSTVAEDVKGVITDVFKIKAKLFRAAYPDIELRIIER